MRFASVLLLSLGLLSPALALDGVVVETWRGDAPAASNRPYRVKVLFEASLWNPGVRIVDDWGREVAGRLEETRPGEKVFWPERGDLPEGQYTVEVDAPPAIETIVVGPDLYPPRLLRATQDRPGRGSPLRLTFSEVLDRDSVGEGVLRVWDLSRPEPILLSGTVERDGDGRTVVFTPDEGPGIPPGGSVRIETVEGGLSDHRGNEVRAGSVVIETLAEETRESDSRVSHSVYWSNRRRIGYVPLGSRETGELVGEGRRSSRLHFHRLWRRRPGRGRDPKELVLDPRVGLCGHSVLYGVDPVGDRVVSLWSGGHVQDWTDVREPRGIAVHPDGEFLYVSTGSGGGRLLSLPLGTRGEMGDEPAATIPLGADPSGVACSRDFVLALSGGEARAVLADPETLEVLETFPTDPRPVDATIRTDPDGNRLAVVSCRGRGRAGGSVLVFDLDRRVLVARLEGFRRPGRVGGRGTRVWVVEEGAGRVTPIDVSLTPEVGEPVPCGRRPVDVAVSPRNPDVLFVVNGRRGTLTVVDASRPAARTVLRAPGALAVTSWEEE